MTNLKYIFKRRNCILILKMENMINLKYIFKRRNCILIFTMKVSFTNKPPDSYLINDPSLIIFLLICHHRPQIRKYLPKKLLKKHPF